MSGRLARGRVDGAIRVPGSKSAIIRALAIAALAPGRSLIHHAFESDDTKAMVRVLRAMGVEVDTSSDPWVVDGGTLRRPDEPLDCGESGLTARIAIGLATVVEGEVTVTGRGRLAERPMTPLVEAIRGQAVPVSAPTGGLPVTVTGTGGLWGGEIVVTTSDSTQFLSTLLLVAPTADNSVALRVDHRVGAFGYVEMTTEMMAVFGARPIETPLGYEIPDSGYRAAEYTVPPDASSAAYPAVAAAITGGQVELSGLTPRDRQPDMAVLGHLEDMGCRVESGENGVRVLGPETLFPLHADLEDAPDGALALAVACLFATGPSRLTGLATLRHKESDRLAAMVEGLSALGARVEAGSDFLELVPGGLRSGAVRAHGDHRVAMSLALAGLVLEGVEVDDPGVVAKTWPDFWDAMNRLVPGQ